jgi:hypothetical protein
MVQVMAQLGSSGEFHADVPSQAALRGDCRAILIVQKGRVVSCFILNKYGQKLYHGVEAAHLLSSCGVLDWRIASSNSAETTAPTAKSPENNRRLFPYRLAVPVLQMRTWSPLERSVYLLSDGTRSIEQIATLLSRPLSKIEMVIYKLESSGAIVRR